MYTWSSISVSWTVSVNVSPSNGALRRIIPDTHFCWCVPLVSGKAQHGSHWEIWLVILITGCLQTYNGKLYVAARVDWKLLFLKQIILEVALGVCTQNTFIIWTWLVMYIGKRLNQWKLFLFLQLTEQDGGRGRVGCNKCLLQQ